MGKKLVSLVLVLFLGNLGLVSGWWVGPSATGPQGDWENPDNWSSGVVPGVGDAIVNLQRSDGTGSNIKVSSAVPAGVKPQITAGTGLVKLEIRNGGSITDSGSFDGYTNSLAATIDAGGAWNACTTGGSFKMASNTAAGVTNFVTVNVYGTLNVKSSGTAAILGMVNDTRSGTSGTNSATVNIRSGGLVDVDAYTIGLAGVQYGTGHINIYDGGTFKIKGDASIQVNTDILASKIVGIGGDLVIDTTTQSGYTLVYIPEPATVALLGLGALLMRRRRN